MKDSGNVPDRHEAAVTSRPRSQARSDATSTQSDRSSRHSTKSARSQAGVNADEFQTGVDVQSERSSPQASDHYSEDFAEASIASSKKSTSVKGSLPKKTKKSSPPS